MFLAGVYSFIFSTPFLSCFSLRILGSRLRVKSNILKEKPGKHLCMESISPELLFIYGQNYLDIPFI